MKKLVVIIPAIIVAFAATQLIAGGKGSPTGNVEKEAVCHKPGTPAEKTLFVPAVAVPGHLGHGDSKGECGSGDQPT